MTAASGSTSRRLLLVEDDDDSAALFTSHAERLGHRVVRARNGEDAVRTAENSTIDLAVVDLLLPGVSGWDVVRALHSGNTTASCPIVVCSVLDRQDYPKGVQGRLPKPYTRRQVEQMLQRLLPGAGPR
ncbi:MAG: response regulator [Jatrophihabitantaceae bacterium]